MGWSHLEIFSRTAGQEKMRFAWKFSDIVQIQVCSNHGPRGHSRENILMCLYWEKNLQNQLTDSNQTWYNIFGWTE
jgi:hypothetical protein